MISSAFREREKREKERGEREIERKSPKQGKKWKNSHNVIKTYEKL